MTPSACLTAGLPARTAEDAQRFSLSQQIKRGVDSLHWQINAVCNYSTGWRIALVNERRQLYQVSCSLVLLCTFGSRKARLAGRVATLVSCHLSAKPRQGRGSHPAACSSPPADLAIPAPCAARVCWPPWLPLSPCAGASVVLGCGVGAEGSVESAGVGRANATRRCAGGRRTWHRVPSSRPASPVWLLGTTYASAGRAHREPRAQLALNEWDVIAHVLDVEYTMCGCGEQAVCLQKHPVQ